MLLQETQKGYEKILDDAYTNAKERTEIRLRDWLDSPWKSKIFDFLDRSSRKKCCSLYTQLHLST